MCNINQFLFQSNSNFVLYQKTSGGKNTCLFFFIKFTKFYKVGVFYEIKQNLTL